MVCCFKKKTAYEMRISEWSSDVCSSELEKVRCRRHDVDLAEIQVFVERAVGGAEIALILGREITDREVGARRDLDRHLMALALVSHEEVRDVLDDRAAERAAELHVLGLQLLAAVEQLIGALLKSEEHKTELQSLRRIS